MCILWSIMPALLPTTNYSHFTILPGVHSSGYKALKWGKSEDKPSCDALKDYFRFSHSPPRLCNYRQHFSSSPIQMDFKEDGGKILLLSSHQAVLVVTVALTNHLLCYESPTTIPNMPFSLCPLPYPFQLQILSPCLIHQLISNASCFSFFSLQSNSQFSNLWGKFIILPCHQGANKNVKAVSKCSEQ